MTKLKLYLPLLCLGIASLLQAWLTDLPARAAEPKQTRVIASKSEFYNIHIAHKVQQ